MKQLKISLIAVCLAGFGTSGLLAQETVPASGGNASGSGGSASYSVGQVEYATYAASNGFSMAEGVQQPYEISIVTGIEEFAGINLVVTVFPNPVKDYLVLKIENPDSKNLMIRLFDIKGKLLENQKLVNIQTRISMENKVPGTYFLKVTKDDKTVKTFKIIKN